MTVTSEPSRPPAWALLEHALRTRRAVNVRYHGHDRTVCPYALGWNNGRATVLAYQTAGRTSAGDLPDNPRQRWRSLHIDQIEHATITLDPWRTADNYTRPTVAIIAIDH